MTRSADLLERTHAEIGMELWLKGAKRRVGYGSEADTPEEAHRAVAELLRLARFALLVREIAECRPADTVLDAVTQAHLELESWRPK